jgi:chemosensory pili system protein ChpA (sensor histidine kinase/response regulator)
MPSNTAILSTVEIEMLLSDIRGRLLLHARNETTPEAADEIFSWTERLCLSMELPDSGEEDVARSLAESIYALKGISGKESSRLLRISLDALTRVEAAVLSSNTENDAFELDIAAFIEASFDEMIPRRAEAPALASTNDDKTEGFEIDAELLEIFSGEADELLRKIEECLDNLVADPEDTESLWEIRRNAHTFKGAAGIVGLKSASKIAHRIEDLLDRFAEMEAGSGSPILELLQNAATCLRSMTTADGEQSGSETIGQLHSAFDTALSHISKTNDKQSVTATETNPEEPTVKADTNDAIATGDRKRSIIRVPLEKLDDLESYLHDLVVAGSAIERRLGELDRQIEELNNTTRRLQSTSGKIENSFEADMLGRERLFDTASLSNTSDDHFDALEFDRYTEFHQNTRVLAETASDSFAINTALDAIRSGLETLFERQKRNIKSVQDAVLRIRMVEFGTIKTRLQRAARITADELGREVELFLVNEEARLDTQMLELLSEPLMHLIRNAVVHGIETPEIRRLLGKPEIGKITVAFEDQITNIVLSVSDDGAGISATRLKEKAVSDGILAKSKAKSMTDQEALRLIFEPGLTTAEKLSLSAGRGIGMSIVKAGIEAAGGSIDIDSKPQAGTRMVVCVPLKVAVLNAIIVRVDRQYLAIPSDGVIQIAYKSSCRFSEVKGAAFLISDTGQHPVRDVCRSLYGTEGETAAEDKTIVIVEIADGQIALIVDEVIRTEELALKSPGWPLDRIKGLLGVAITGNDEVLPVVNVSELAAMPQNTGRVMPPAAEPPEKAPIRSILIVDDSPSVRHMTSKVVENAGWRAVAARDGVEALALVMNGGEPPTVIVTDIEMPRMDGFELIRSLKSNKATAGIPIIVVTSRAGSKHRDMAERMGITKFLSKPFNENELVGTIRTCT